MPFFKSRGEPLFEPPVPSPMFGQIVMVRPAMPEQVAVKVPVVGAVPPGPILILPKLKLEIAKLQT